MPLWFYYIVSSPEVVRRSGTSAEPKSERELGSRGWGVGRRGRKSESGRAWLQRRALCPLELCALDFKVLVRNRNEVTFLLGGTTERAEVATPEGHDFENGRLVESSGGGSEFGQEYERGDKVDIRTKETTAKFLQYI